MFQKLANILVFTTLLGISLTNDCGDWVPFKDEKCFKVFEKLVEETMAEEVCRQNTNESVLAMIKTIEEQRIIEKYLKTRSIADNIWIGIKKTGDSFRYSDETDIKYNNWAKDRPLNNSKDGNCVEISVDESNYGKWIDDRCKRKNAVLCERIQPWTVARLQNILMETRRVSNERQDQLTKLIQTQQQSSDAFSKIQNDKIEQNTEIINNLKSNPVPIGFIYTQFLGQSDPKILWPNTEWENVSSKYSGLFFRAEGGQSSPFGEIQDQMTQSFEIYNDWGIGENDWASKEWQAISDIALEKYIYTGRDAGGNTAGINMKHNNEEIRPRNQAIRIWQRIN